MFRRNRLGSRYPAGHGLAWHDWETQESISAPVPINVIARVIRTAWLSIVYPRWWDTESVEWELRTRDAEIERLNKMVRGLVTELDELRLNRMDEVK